MLATESYGADAQQQRRGRGRARGGGRQARRRVPATLTVAQQMCAICGNVICDVAMLIFFVKCDVAENGM